VPDWRAAAQDRAGWRRNYDAVVGLQALQRRISEQIKSTQGGVGCCHLKALGWELKMAMPARTSYVPEIRLR